jgi:hypothetical protein
MWNGWIEFVPQTAGEPVLRTARETTQRSRAALEYWATGLNDLFLDGAFARATRGVEREPVAELVREHPARIVADGISYVVRIYAAEAASGTWIGWIEFHPQAASQPIRYTERETSQPTRDMVAYWAGGLEPVYLEGALGRATHER